MCLLLFSLSWFDLLSGCCLLVGLVLRLNVCWVAGLVGLVDGLAAFVWVLIVKFGCFSGVLWFVIVVWVSAFVAFVLLWFGLLEF